MAWGNEESLTRHSVCPCCPSHALTPLLRLLCLLVPGSPEELRQSPAEPECLRCPVPDRALQARFPRPWKMACKMTHSVPFLLSLRASLVLSCFGYLCYIKVVKSVRCFLLFLGRCGSEQPADLSPAGTGGGLLCLKDRQVWVGPVLGGTEMPLKGGDREFPQAPVHSFMISYTVCP